ncbi:MAG TPA: DUF6232 family protein [Verrucomicrobiae bacterium]|jgi:hypothetical protein
MALIACKECSETVSTEAAACPHCGAPQQPPVPPPLPVQPKEETIYSDNAVVVTNMRVIIGGATYALRNITSVKMLFTPPRLVKPILLLIVGSMILLAALVPMTDTDPAPPAVYVVAGMMIVGAILWMVSAKTKFHVGLSSASGEVHALTSKNRAYIEQIVLSVNEAITRSYARD